jgi:hypothetical protein
MEVPASPADLPARNEGLGALQLRCRRPAGAAALARSRRGRRTARPTEGGDPLAPAVPSPRAPRRPEVLTTRPGDGEERTRPRVQQMGAEASRGAGCPRLSHAGRGLGGRRAPGLGPPGAGGPWSERRARWRDRAPRPLARRRAVVSAAGRGGGPRTPPQRPRPRRGGLAARAGERLAAARSRAGGGRRASRRGGRCRRRGPAARPGRLGRAAGAGGWGGTCCLLGESPAPDEAPWAAGRSAAAPPAPWPQRGAPPAGPRGARLAAHQRRPAAGRRAAVAGDAQRREAVAPGHAEAQGEGGWAQEQGGGRASTGRRSRSCGPPACGAGGSGAHGAARAGPVAPARRVPPRPARRRQTRPALPREIARWRRHPAVPWGVTTDRFIARCSRRFYQSSTNYRVASVSQREAAQAVRRA